MLMEVWVHETVAGKESEAIELAKRTAEIHEGLGVHCRVMRPTAGKLNRLYLVMDFENESARGEYWNETFAVPEHKAIVKEWWDKGLFNIDAMERYHYFDVK